MDEEEKSGDERKVAFSEALEEDKKPTTNSNNNVMSKFSDTTLFYRYTNVFLDQELEVAYQQFCTRSVSHQAHWLLSFTIGGHILFWLIFICLDRIWQNTFINHFPLAYGLADWGQWLYLFILFPFLFFYSDPTTPFLTTNIEQDDEYRQEEINTDKHRFCCGLQKYRLKNPQWKKWVALVLILFVLGLQVWGVYLIPKKRQRMKADLTLVLKCVVAAEKAARIKKDIYERNVMYYEAFIAIFATFVTIIGSVLAVAVRLDFPQVVLVSLSILVSLITLLYSYDIQQFWIILGGYGLPAIMLSVACFNSDRANRFSFLAKMEIEQENVALQKTIEQQEITLMNDEAHEEEETIVHTVFTEMSSILRRVHVPFTDIKLLKVVGRGGMGEVITAEYLGTTVVCKRILRDCLSVASVEAFRHEVELIAGLRHPNIVQFIAASWDNCSNVCMILEYMQNGDLHSVMRSQKGEFFTWSDPLLKMAIDACQGMVYLHSRKIIHRDLKSLNLLCSATFGCKISDFGLSKQKRKHLNTGNKTVVGTPFWLAPEIIRNEKYDSKVDVYSFGIVLTELETGEIPYQNIPETGLKILLKIASNELRPALPESCLPLRRQLIEDCLMNDPEFRPDFAMLLSRLQNEIQQEIVESNEFIALKRRAILERQKRNSCISC